MMFEGLKQRMVPMVVIGAVVNYADIGECKEPATTHTELRFQDIKEQFPLSDVEPYRGSPVKRVLPSLNSVNSISADVVQLTADKKDARLFQVRLKKEDFPRFYDFVAHSVPVLNESELDIVAYLKIETEDGQYEGLILDSKSEPVLYTFARKGSDKGSLDFATTRTRVEVVEFLKSLKGDGNKRSEVRE